MRAIANPDPASDPIGSVIEAVKPSLAELEGYAITDLAHDTEMAELIGRLKSLVSVLVSVIDH